MAEENTQNENATTAEKQTEDVLPQWARDEITKAKHPRFASQQWLHSRSGYFPQP